MPRNGKLVRITFALAAAAAVTALGAGAASAKQSKTTINGAGSTFVSPLVGAWVSPVAKALGITLNYSAVGSGAGIQAITNRTVDFGGSDAPLSPDQFTACKGCIQFPWALASTAVFYNLPGLGFLHLSGPVLAKIYLGQITHWDDPAIKKLNPGRNLPSTAITVVHRSDGSGTTYNFTDYLAHVSKTWRSKVGPANTAVNWPTGVGGSHSAGVAAVVRATPGGIGYAETSFPAKNHLAIAKMENRSGRFVLPKNKGTLAAAQLDTKPAKDGSLSIVDPPKSKKYKNAYPIATYTYAIVAKKSSNAAALKKLINWGITKGQAYGPKLFFVPLPAAVVTFDKKQLAKIGS